MLADPWPEAIAASINRTPYSRYSDPESAGSTLAGGRAAWEAEPAAETVRLCRLSVDAVVDGLLERTDSGPQAWSQQSPAERAQVCLKMLDRLHARVHELAFAVGHTTGQPYAMALAAGGTAATDRGLEAVALALRAQQLPELTVWPAINGTEIVREYRCIPRGRALIIGCSTFPTWNAYPAIFASLATGNSIMVKPHPRAIAPLALSLTIIREVLREENYNPELATIVVESQKEAAIVRLADNCQIIDFTGNADYGDLLEREYGQSHAVFTEKSAINLILIESVADLAGTLKNIALSISLYSGLMCTAPKYIILPTAGVQTDQGWLSARDFGCQLAIVVTEILGPPRQAVEILGTIVSDDINERIDNVIDGLSDGEELLRPSEVIEHPNLAEATVRSPAIVLLAAGCPLRAEENFGPLIFIQPADDLLAACTQDSGHNWPALTASVYSTVPEFLAQARAWAGLQGVALNENLTGSLLMNNSVAFGDFHGSSRNAAANASYVNSEFVSRRFTIAQVRSQRPAQPLG
jgi:phenylacetic acid degradation protein paaN